MAAAFAGAVSMAAGFAGLIVGAIFAGLVYVVIAIIVKIAGVNWINKLMPAAVIGPTVAIIGLSLAGNAIGDLQKGGVSTAHPLICVLVGLITLVIVILCATYGKKMTRLIPFILGILGGYAVATVFTVIGNAAGIDALKVIDFTKISSLWANGVGLETFLTLPDFTFVEAIKGVKEIDGA